MESDVGYVKINRPLLTLAELNKLSGTHDRELRKHSLKDVMKNTCLRTAKMCLPNSSLRDSESRKEYLLFRIVAHWIISIFPCVTILRKYDIKGWLLNDMIAGLTVGIMHVPQGMAYAILATLPPVYGLYTSFFPPLIYFIMGTSRHISLGTIAVVSLLTGEVLDRKVGLAELNTTNTIICEKLAQVQNNQSDGFNRTAQDCLEHSTELRVMYAPALAAMVGVIQVLMGLFRLGGLTRYLSVPMTSGFTVGVAVHVLTSQVRSLLGVNTMKPTGLFTVPMMYYEVFRAFQTINWITVGISVACIIILAVFKIIISPKFAKITKIPFPIDLLIVILATTISHVLKLNRIHNVSVVGTVSKGIPRPIVPDLRSVLDTIPDVIVLAVVSFSVNISLSRMFAKTFAYKIDCNQELFAYGMSNIFGSFFHCYASAGSLSRSAVQVSTGGKTQVATIFSSVLLIFVLCFIGPLFYSVPNCCLSAIIVVALRGMFAHTRELKTLWKHSILDFFTWVITFLITCIVDVKFGLLAGLLFSVFTIILRTQAPQIRMLKQVGETEFYRPVSTNVHNVNCEPVSIVRYEGSVYFASADNFRKRVHTETGTDPIYTFGRLCKYCSKLQKINSQLVAENPGSLQTHSNGTQTELRTIDAESTNVTEFASKPNKASKTIQKRINVMNRLNRLKQNCVLQYLIFDCSLWNFVDSSGTEQLKQLHWEYKKLCVRVLYAAPADAVYDVLSSFDDKSDFIFPSVHDAFLYARNLVKSHEEHLDELLQSVYETIKISVNGENVINVGQQTGLNTPSIVPSLEGSTYINRGSIADVNQTTHFSTH